MMRALLLFSAVATVFSQMFTTIPGSASVMDECQTRFIRLDLPESRGNNIEPRVSENWIVWSTDRGGTWDVYGYDLRTGVERPVAVEPGDQRVPDVSDDIVAWEHQEGVELPRVKWMDLRTGRSSDPSIVGASNRSPRVSKGVIVWLVSTEGDTFIYAYHIEGGRREKIGQAKGSNPQPQIAFSYPWVVATGGFGSAVRAINLETLDAKDISGRLEYVAPVDVQGNQAFWNMHVGMKVSGAEGIYQYDLKTGAVRRLAAGPRANFAISGDLVFLPRLGTFSSEVGTFLGGITSLSIITGEEGSLPTTTSFGWWLSASRDVVAWVEYVNGLKEVAAARVSRCLDRPLSNGHFYTQASGQVPESGLGYAVTNDAGIPFWDEFQNLGGVSALGYPVSQRFTYKGFATHAFQKAVMQWQPGGKLFFLNVFDELHNAGKDNVLLATRATPRQLDPSFDAGKRPEQIVQDRLALLDANSAIRDRYFSAPDPLLLYGLPTSGVHDMGNAFVVRTQRAVIQQWKIDVPWASAGQVTVANGGDIAKEMGLFPADVVAAETPP